MFGKRKEEMMVYVVMGLRHLSLPARRVRKNMRRLT